MTTMNPAFVFFTRCPAVIQINKRFGRSGDFPSRSECLLRWATLLLSLTIGIAHTIAQDIPGNNTQDDVSKSDSKLMLRRLKTNEGRQVFRTVVQTVKEGSAEDLKKLLDYVTFLRKNPLDEETGDDLNQVSQWGQEKLKELSARPPLQPAVSGTDVKKKFLTKDGKPATDLTLRVTDSEGHQKTVETDSNGEAKVPGEPQSIVVGGPYFKTKRLTYAELRGDRPITVGRKPLDLSVTMNLSRALFYLGAKEKGRISQETAKVLDPLINALLNQAFGFKPVVKRSGIHIRQREMEFQYEVEAPGRPVNRRDGLGGILGGLLTNDKDTARNDGLGGILGDLLKKAKDKETARNDGLGGILGDLLGKEEVEKSLKKEGSLGNLLEGLLEKETTEDNGDSGGLGGLLKGLLEKEDAASHGGSGGLGRILGGLLDQDENSGKESLKALLNQLLAADVDTADLYAGDTRQGITSSDDGARTNRGARSDGARSVPHDPHLIARGNWGRDYFDQWAVRRVGFRPLDRDNRSAWPRLQPDPDKRVKPCVVAVIGTGVDWMHPELFGRMWYNNDEIPDNGKDDDDNGFTDDFAGWNFIEKNDDVMDYGGHDTHVAGLIAARFGNGYGIAGINPWSRVMPLKVADFRAESNSVMISRAIRYAVDEGARVINISYGGPLSRMIERAITEARSEDVLVVVAAGNQGDDAAKRDPANCAGAITVAATDFDNKRTGFSNWGQPVDIAAPGMDVLSLRARNTDFLLYVVEGNPNYKAGTGIVGENRDLYRASGTSFATPIVAGTASLIFSMRPELNAEQVRRMLLMSADDIGQPGRDQYTGAGLLNAVKAMQADPDYYLFARISEVVAQHKSRELVVNVNGQVVGSQFDGRWLQIGFGEKPEAWKTISYSTQAVERGSLGTIPIAQFDRRGTWTIRVLTRDRQDLVKQARAILNLNEPFIWP